MFSKTGFLGNFTVMARSWAGSLVYLERSRIRFLAGLVPLLVLAVLLFAGQIPAICMLVLVLLTAGISVRLSGGSRFLAALFLGAFSLRLVVALGTYWGALMLGQKGIGDEVSFNELAWAIAQAWRGLGPAVASNWGGHYATLSAAIYLVSGENMLVLKVMNAGIGAGVAVAIAYLGSRLFTDERIGRVAGLLTAGFPSMVFWSALNIRDALCLFMIALVFIGAGLFFAHPRPSTWVLVIVPWLLIQNIRYWIFVPVGWLLPIGVLGSELRTRGQRTVSFIAISASVLLATYGLGYGVFGLGAVSSAPVAEERGAMAVGANSSYVPTPVPAAALPQPTSDSPIPASPVEREGKMAALLAHLPVGLAYVIAAPFPWALHNWLARLSFAETTIWYLLLIAAVLGGIAHKRSWRRWYMLVLYVAGVIFILAIIEGNVGTLVRHRAMLVMPFVFIFSAAGMAELWDKSFPSTRSKLSA